MAETPDLQPIDPGCCPACQVLAALAQERSEDDENTPERRP